MTLHLDESGAIACIRFPALLAIPFVGHAVTTRRGGHSVGPYAGGNVGLAVGDDPAAVLANRAAAAALVGCAGVQPVTLRQVHGVSAVLAREPGEPGKPLAEGDLLATGTAAVPLLVQAADCLPLLLVDRERRAVAAVHAGWRGAAAGAGGAAVASMIRLFGSRAADLVVGVGPGIGGCCYEVGDDVAAAVAGTAPGESGVVLPVPGARPHLDLGAALVAQLVAAGVPPDQIQRAGLCTACRTDLFYSHRREGEPTGRFAAVIAIAPAEQTPTD